MRHVSSRGRPGTHLPSRDVSPCCLTVTVPRLTCTHRPGTSSVLPEVARPLWGVDGRKQEEVCTQKAPDGRDNPEADESRMDTISL